ncbi:hypothetical protein M9H77_22302 [Catharanthus roseus]|uniref:Uncharacterized protein n=1 Tax=Catharanthus roseus TaxID=4058 RepID=A0ACC0AQ39_CATRO|nr:hypothetical protein M9H77_22302 [Catharanthus roseus]
MEIQSSHLPNNRKKRVIDELIRGRELAYELQIALNSNKSSSFSDSIFTSFSTTNRNHQDLVTKILGSFSETLSILDYAANNNIDEFSVGGSWKSEDSSGSCKPSAAAKATATAATSKERRGCYKRRKTSETWTQNSSTLIDDGYAWRKYGQKVILNADYPRNYFRCTHKFDQECQATKQVQMIQENPPLYRTTYHGHHTCRNLHKAPQIILDSTTSNDSSSVLLSFNHQSNETTAFPLVGKQETKDEEEVHQIQRGFFPNQFSDYFLLPPPPPASADLTGAMSSPLSAGSDHGGVYSCTASTHTLEMDHMVVGSVDDFDDVLQFEF